MLKRSIIVLLSLVVAAQSFFLSAAEIQQYDVCVYGATPSGILAAVAVSREGKSVVIIEPGRWVGGILGAGLKPVQDMPNYAAVGGTTRELMLRLGVRSKEENIGLDEVHRLSRRGMSPKYVREDFLQLLADHDIEVVYNHRINRTVKTGKRIVSAFFDLAPFDEFGRPAANTEEYERIQVDARVFVDASYEGDLMARSGVSFQVGRESSIDYGEEFAGVRPIGDVSEDHHGLGNITPISPFIDPDNPESGLLPMVEDDHGKSLGSGDHYTQAYNFRYYVTSDPDRRAPIDPPEDYDPEEYELLGRYVEYLKNEIEEEEELFRRLSWIFPGWRNRGDYNYHRRSLISNAPLGVSHLYAKGDYATKALIWKDHQDYVRGVYHFLTTDSRVPKAFRERTASLGLDKYHHPDTNGWPHQLYIRVSRRLMGGYTVTEHDVFNRTNVKDSIGLAQYGLDTYPSRRVWFEEDGKVFVAIEGNMFVGGTTGPTNVPYPIPYRSITPLRHECTNLLVPVLFSSSHLGYSSARMEPTFMIVGESAGIAAVQAIQENVPVQDINVNRYLNRLEEIGQYLYWEEGGIRN